MKVVRSVSLEEHISLISCMLQDVQRHSKPQCDPEPDPYTHPSILILILVHVIVLVRVPVRIFIRVFVLLSSLKTANDIHENRIKLFLAIWQGEFQT